MRFSHFSFIWQILLKNKFYENQKMLITQSIQRNKVLSAVCILVIIVLGLASRKYNFLFPEILGKYPGDALWSLMVYWIWAFFKPAMSPTRIAIFTLITACLDEFSQLIQTPWLNVIRHTTWGHLVLGTMFSWYDIAFYVIGVLIGLVLDLVIIFVKKQARPTMEKNVAESEY